MLEPLDLSYVIKNDVLTVTSIEAKRTDVEFRTYKVADLVTPIPNFASSYEDGLAGALACRLPNDQSATQRPAGTGLTLTSMAAGSASNMPGAGMNPNMLAQYNGMGAQNRFGPTVTRRRNARGCCRWR